MGPHLVVEERSGKPSMSLQLSRDREEGEDSRRDNTYRSKLESH